MRHRIETVIGWRQAAGMTISNFHQVLTTFGAFPATTPHILLYLSCYDSFVFGFFEQTTICWASSSNFQFLEPMSKKVGR
jgi:hypothetical protein